MKSIALYLILTGLSFTFTGQTISSSCQAGDSVYKLYKNDADRMTIRKVNYIGSNYKDSVRINKQISRDYLSALIAVYNATDFPAVDTIHKTSEYSHL